MTTRRSWAIWTSYMQNVRERKWICGHLQTINLYTKPSVNEETLYRAWRLLIQGVGTLEGVLMINRQVVAGIHGFWSKSVCACQIKCIMKKLILVPEFDSCWCVRVCVLTCSSGVDTSTWKKKDICVFHEILERSKLQKNVLSSSTSEGISHISETKQHGRTDYVASTERMTAFTWKE